MNYSANGQRQFPLYNDRDTITCDWDSISEQLIRQWPKLTRSELENTGHERQGVAELILQKYGVNPILAENYLRNLERTLPLFH